MTLHGSCHCGRVRYRLEADPQSGTGRCNCSYCGKVRNWSLAVFEPGAFGYVSGEEVVTRYGFRPDSTMHHHFCSVCGVRIGCFGSAPGVGFFASVAVASLDGLSPEQLAALSIRYYDGRHDDFEGAPAVTRHL